MHIDDENARASYPLAVDGDFDGELIERAPDVVLWIDAAGRLISAHDAACRSLGYASGELIGRPWHQINTRLRERDWGRVWERTRRVGQWFWRTRYRRRDGTEVAVEVTFNLARLGNQDCILAVGRDVSDLVRREEQVRRLESQMLHAQKLQSLGVLAGGIAHDFNNLLVGILGNASLAKMKLPADSPAGRQLGAVEITARRAADLAGQMLAYSGKGERKVEVFDLNELILEMAQLLQSSISKKASIEMALAEAPPLLEGDATQIRQVAMNLITNASEAIGNCEGTIRISTGELEAGRAYLASSLSTELLPEGRYVYLEVADTGCGMPSEVRESLFEPFFTTKDTGRGLGMSAVLGIVREHQGAIRLDSEPGRGSRFRVLFPGGEGQPKPSPVDDDESLALWRGHGSILIVDDEKVIRLVARKTLEQAGFDVVLAGDGVEALEAYATKADDIVAVLLDIAMPRLDGIETLFELRCRRPDLRVLLSSGYNEREVVPSFTDRRFSSYLKKPYQPRDLVREVRQLIEAS